MKRTPALFVMALLLAAGLWWVAALGLTAPGSAASPLPLAAASASYTLTFQQGVSPAGYAGAADTWIDSWNPTVNHGTEDLRVKGDGPQRALLRFDLAQHLPPGAQVTSATLWLQVTWQSAAATIRVGAYRVLQAWVANQATWNLASSGVAWSGGAGCEGSSRSATPAGTFEVSQGQGTQVAVDVTSAVQAWAASPAANQGLLLKGDLGSETYGFASSEHFVADYRPRLVVTYEGQPPLATPTPTRTRTPTPTPSAYTVLTSTLGDWKGWNPDDCLKVNDVVHDSRISVMFLIYRGTPWSAKLHVTFCNTDSPHPVYLNGVVVGTAPDFYTSNCECNATPGSGYAMSFDIDPALLATGPSYANLISTTNALYPWDTYKVYHTYLVLTGDVTGTTRSYFTIGTDEDGTALEGGMQLPIDYKPAVAHPLLVVIPGTGEDKDDSLNAYAARANEQGWLLASLDMRLTNAYGDSFMRTPSLAVQHDVMALVHYMQSNYHVDASRIYIAGFSTGAGTAATVAAKNPDVFAALLDYAGPTDYGEWYYEREDLQGELARQFNGWPGDYFEYPRRSSRALARNLQYVPMRIIHGTADDRVPFSQSSRLYNETMPLFYDPPSTGKEFYSHSGDHQDWVVGLSEGDMDWLAAQTLAQNPRELQIITDEAKDYYWLRVDKPNIPADEWTGWVEMEARYDPVTKMAWVTARDGEYAEGEPLSVALNLSKMGFPTTSAYDIEEFDDATGEYVFHAAVPPVGGKLTWTVPRNAVGRVDRRYTIAPAGTVIATRTPTPSPPSTRTATPTSPSPSTPTATRTPGPGQSVHVMLDPSAVTVAKDQVFSVDIQIEAGSQPVDSAEIHLYFDRTYLQVVDAAGNPAGEIQSNGYLSTIIRNAVYTDTAQGYIFFAAGALQPDDPRPSGTFALATVRFKALWGTGTGNTALTFGLQFPYQTDVLFEGESLLAGVGNAVVTIAGEAPAATATHTATAMPTATPTRTATPTAGPTPRPTVQVCLQKGAQPDPSNAGVYDTYLSSWDPSGIYGTDGALALRQDQIKRILLRFDLAPNIPSGSQIVVTQARLSMWVLWVSNEVPIHADIYPVNRHWSEASANWYSPWTTAGCSAIPADREGALAAAAMIGPTWGSWLEWDVTNLVQSWASGQSANEGLIVLGRSGDYNREVTFRSSDHPEPLYRPKLCVSYYVAQTSLPYDLDDDCDVDVADVMMVASRWPSRAGDVAYLQRYDLDNDGDIDVVDIMTVVGHWGETCGS